MFLFRCITYLLLLAVTLRCIAVVDIPVSSFNISLEFFLLFLFSFKLPLFLQGILEDVQLRPSSLHLPVEHVHFQEMGVRGMVPAHSKGGVTYYCQDLQEKNYSSMTNIIKSNFLTKYRSGLWCPLLTHLVGDASRRMNSNLQIKIYDPIISKVSCVTFLDSPLMTTLETSASTFFLQVFHHNTVDKTYALKNCLQPLCNHL